MKIDWITLTEVSGLEMSWKSMMHIKVICRLTVITEKQVHDDSYYYKEQKNITILS